MTRGNKLYCVFEIGRADDGRGGCLLRVKLILLAQNVVFCLDCTRFALVETPLRCRRRCQGTLKHISNCLEYIDPPVTIYWLTLLPDNISLISVRPSSASISGVARSRPAMSSFSISLVSSSFGCRGRWRG